MVVVKFLEIGPIAAAPIVIGMSAVFSFALLIRKIIEGEEV